MCSYASPSSGEAYRDRRLTTNFELWVEIFCADMFPYEDSKILSVCPYPEKRNHPGFVNISPTLVIIHQWKGVLEHYSMKTQKVNLKKIQKLPKLNFVHTLSVCTLRKEITLSSSICPTLVFDMLMERWSRVLQHWNPKSRIFFTKVWDWRNWILSVPQVSVPREKKSPWLRQYQSYISNHTSMERCSRALQHENPKS